MTDKRIEAFDKFLRSTQEIAEVTNDKGLLPKVQNSFRRAKELSELLANSHDANSITAKIEQYETDLRNVLRESRGVYKLARERVRASRDHKIASSKLQFIEFAREWRALKTDAVFSLPEEGIIEEILDSIPNDLAVAQRAIAVVELRNLGVAMKSLVWQVRRFRFSRLRRSFTVRAWRFFWAAFVLGIIVNALVVHAPLIIGIVIVPVLLWIATEFWIGPYIERRTSEKRKLNLIVAIRQLAFTESGVQGQLSLLNSKLNAVNSSLLGNATPKS